MRFDAMEAGQSTYLDDEGEHEIIKSVFPDEYILLEQFEERERSSIRLNTAQIKRLAEAVGYEVTEK